MPHVGRGSGVEPVEAHLRAVLGVLEEGIVSVSADDRIVTVNDAFLRMAGLDRSALVGDDWWRTLRPRCPDGGPLPNPVPIGEDVAFRVTRASDGVTRDLVMRREPLPDGGTVLAVRDRTEQRRTSARLEALSVRDALTGLPNRGAVLAALDEAVASGAPFAVLLVDLDGFNAVNVGLGQAAGDAVLREAAGRLRAVAPRTATVARFGGDDFLVVAPLDDPTRARATAERLLDAFAAPFTAADGALLSASVGIADAHAADDSAGLVSAAEAALGLARRRGRGLVVAYDDALRRDTEDRLALVADLRGAIESGALRTAYQPIVALKPGFPVIGVEALARWTHPQRGEISPAVFVALAEESGLVRALGRRVLARACHEIARVREELAPAGAVRLSVNVSARQLATGLLEQDVLAALQASGLPPDALALELTESALMDDSAPALEGLATLRRHGVRLLIDDFGTGYSSLMRLRQLPVDGLKIDRSFVAGLGSAPVDTAIVEAVLTMARALRLPVVAEGVEHSEQAERLRELGCPFAQGYLIGRPMPLDDLRALLCGRTDELRALRADR